MICLEKEADKIFSLIVIDYYSIEKTLKYIEQIQQHILYGKQFHAIIVDNSEDGSGLAVTELW